MTDSCVHPAISSQLSDFLPFLFHIQDLEYNPIPCNLSHHCDSLCSRMMVYKWMVHTKMNQIHQYFFCHRSTPQLGEHIWIITTVSLSSQFPHQSDVYFTKGWYCLFCLSCKDIIIGSKLLPHICNGSLRNATRVALTSNIGTVATAPSVRGTECNVCLRKFSW